MAAEKNLTSIVLNSAALPLGDMVTIYGSVGYTHASWSWGDMEGEGTTKKICSGIGIRIGFSIFLQ
jgi:hypothetical protein